MSTPAEQFWWLGPFVAAVAAGLVLWFNWGQHKVRARRMKAPYRLVINTADKSVTELRAPPDSEVSIQLSIWPQLKYHQYEIVFGFLGDIAARPAPKKTMNEFIKWGRRREQSPDTDENHSIDRNDNYHIREDRQLTPPNNYTYGFIVQTREPGVYPIRFEAITDCGESHPVNALYLTVESRKD